MSSHTIEVRALRAGDRTQWDVLWQGYLDFYEEELAPQITENTWRRLIDPVDQPHGLVALDGERIVGFVHYHFHLSTWATTDCCYLEDLYVDDAVRGRGAGRALIEAVYADADRRNADRVYWHTQNTNSRARVLYDKVASLTPFVQYRRDPP